MNEQTNTEPTSMGVDLATGPDHCVAATVSFVQAGNGLAAGWNVVRFYNLVISEQTNG